MARRRRNKKNHYRNEDPKKKVPKEDEATKSLQRKLLLTKGIKAALLAIGVFTEEQADAIITETQSNLPKDFQKALDCVIGDIAYYYFILMSPSCFERLILLKPMHTLCANMEYIYSLTLYQR